MDNFKQLAVRTYNFTGAFLRNGLAVFGGIAVIALLMGARPAAEPIIQPGSTPAAVGAIRHEGISLLVSTADTENAEYRSLAAYLSRRYRVAQDATEQLVEAAHTAGRRTGVDPLLILAVIAVESGFNPIAESVMGAKGLMQVIPRYHQDKLDALGGEDSVFDPMTNIMVGARILKDAVRRGGGLMPGLQLYNGAFSDDTQQYAQKVMAEKQRMTQMLKRAKPRTAT